MKKALSADNEAKQVDEVKQPHSNLEVEEKIRDDKDNEAEIEALKNEIDYLKQIIADKDVPN